MGNKKRRQPNKKDVPRPKGRAVASEYVHYKSPVFKSAKPISLASADDVALRGDPFLAAARIQYVHKADFSVETYTVGQCTGISKYAAGNSTTVHRLYWVPPMMVKQPDAGTTKGGVEGDQRGLFADIGTSNIRFKNVLRQPIKIIINSPRARIADTANCYLRRFKRELLIGPGQVKRYSVTWGDKANIFTPLAATIVTQEETPQKRIQAFAIVDYVIVIPDVDEMSGKPNSAIADQSAVELSVKQQYIATSSYGNFGDDAVIFVQRKPLLVVKLAGLKAMMYESPIALEGFLPNQDLSVRSVAGANVLFEGHDAICVPDLEGRTLAIHGVNGYWKVQRGNIVHWDLDVGGVSTVSLDPIVVAPGCPYVVLPGYSKIELKDVIGWLTTVTEILTVVSAFI